MSAGTPLPVPVKPAKLVLVSDTFPPEVNGVAMTLERLVRGLQSSGVDTTVITPKRMDRSSRWPFSLVQLPGLPVPRYPGLRLGLPAGRFLRDLWRQDPPDIVHLATEGPLGWSALRQARIQGLKVVSSFHTNFHSYGKHYGYGGAEGIVLRGLRIFHNRTLATFVPSRDIHMQLTQKGFTNLRLMERGVDTALFGPVHRDEALRCSWGVDAGTPVALHVGRLAREKNLGLLDRAYHIMRESLPDLKLVVVGEGPELSRLKAKLPDSVFSGLRRGADLAAHYASADCFLFPSLSETFGNVVLEAMASALPVLAFDYASAGSFIRDGQSGLLTPYGNCEAFLIQAMRLAKLRSEWTSIGRAARQAIIPFSWDRIVDRYLSEISSMASPPVLSAL